MQTIHLNEKNLSYWQKRSKENVIALGFFDGIHKGHQKVIRAAAEVARKRNVGLTVMSFFPHPKTVLSDGKITFNYLMPLEEKAETLQSLGVDRFYIVKFDRNFASLSPGEFIDTYLLKLGTFHAVVGYDFSYGKKGAGHVGRMKDDSFGKLEVTKVDRVEHLGQKISSTRIRNTIAEGQVEDLPTLMGRFYEVKGRIINSRIISVESCYMLPGDGVYEVTIKSEHDIFYTQVVVNQTRGVFSIMDKRLKQGLDDGEISITWRKNLSKKIVFDYS